MNSVNFLKSRILSSFHDQRAMPFLWAVLLFGIATGVFMGVLNNYLHEILRITKVERGWIEFPRELPGLLLVFLVALLYRFSETRLLRISFFIAFIGVTGMVLWGAVRWSAVLMIIFWSTGEHLIMPIRQSMGVHMARPDKPGLALGTVRGFSNTGQLIGYYMIPLVFLLLPFAPQRGTFGYFRLTFILAGIGLLSGMLFISKIRDLHKELPRQRLYFRKKFTKYYILEMFFGARKQVFLTFAPYVLVVKYNIATETLALLYGITSTINIVIGPLIGRLIDRIGYRTVIVIDTILLILLCLAYGFAHHLLPPHAAFIMICVVFIMDAVLFVVTMARTVYVKSVSDTQQELTSTLSTGISINHLISILIAVLGGYIWNRLGIEALFTLAACFGLGSFFFSLTLPKHKP